MAILAVRRPAAVAVDSLIDALWSDVAPVSARKTVQNNILRVRRKLGATTVETVGDGYRLGAVVDTDLARFERAMRHPDRCAGPIDWDETLSWCPERPLEELSHWGPADARRAELEHEVQHHGQLIRFVYGNALTFPESWHDRYTVG